LCPAVENAADIERVIVAFAGGATWPSRGNVIGATQLIVEVGPKPLELAHELAPTATLVALLVNPNNPSAENSLVAALHSLKQKRVLP
jgi:hypothetical protein